MGVSTAVEVGAGFHHECATIQDGTAVCWGRNNAGQLGDGGSDPRLRAVGVVGLTGSTTTVGGGSAQLRRLENDTVVCWGANASGQLGNGTTDVSTSPVVVIGIQPPPNDHFADATKLSGIGGTVQGHNAHATLERGEPVLGGGATGHTVWWHYTPARTASCSFDRGVVHRHGNWRSPNGPSVGELGLHLHRWRWGPRAPGPQILTQVTGGVPPPHPDRRSDARARRLNLVGGSRPTTALSAGSAHIVSDPPVRGGVV